MQPSRKYNEYLHQSGFYADTAQQHALFLLDHLQQEFLHHYSQQPGFLSKLGGKLKKNQHKVKGLYFWGGVGRGKTFLMDIFFETLPFRHKKRFHFHHFMQQIHDQLGRAEKGKDPVREIGRQFTRDTQLLCLDEFVVTDIGDAMLIGRLLETLFEQGLVLITTSNSPPDALYPEGLQRSRFLPAIDLIAQHCLITNLDGGRDYRMLGLKQTRLFQVPDDEAALQSIRQYLKTHLLRGHSQGSLSVNGRDIHYEFRAEDTIWFSFDELCRTARSRFDYLEIAREFKTLVLTGIQPMNDQVNDVARRFVSLIDVLYDHRIKLICTASVAIDELYQQEFLAFEFQRTRSRLQEMQSLDYIGQSHLP